MELSSFKHLACSFLQVVFLNCVFLQAGIVNIINVPLLGLY